MAEFVLQCKDYKEIQHEIAGAAVVAGEFDVVNDVNGFHLAIAAVGDESTLIVQAEKVKCPKQASLAINEGDVVYWDNTAKEIDKTNSNILAGFCVRRAAQADTHVVIDFDGRSAFLKT